MNKWLDFLISAKEITSIYGSGDPSLLGVNIHEVALRRDGPNVALRFDLADFPDDPPKKWILSGFNCAQITLVFSGVSDFEMKGWGVENLSDINIFRGRDDLVGATVLGDNLSVTIKSSFVYVEKVSAYMNRLD